MTDWADECARHLMVIAFTDADARDDIADVLRLVRNRGKLDMLEYTKELLSSAKEEQTQ